MSKKSRYYILSATSLASYFTTGILIVDHNSPSSISGWILLSTSIIFLSFGAFFILLLPHYKFYTSRSFGFIKKYSVLSDTDASYLFCVIPVLLYLQFWWYKFGISSWSVGFISAGNIMMLLFSIIIAALMYEFHPDIQQPAHPVRAILKINMGKKIFFWKPYIVPVILYLVFLRVMIAVSPNDVTIRNMERLNSLKYSQKETLAVITVNKISIKDFMDRLSGGMLPEFAKIAGESVIGIMVDSSDSQIRNNYLFNNKTFDRINHQNFPISGAVKPHPVISFLKTLVLFPDNEVESDLRTPSQKNEPFWDTAVRFGYSTGMINSSYSQKHLDTGFFVSDRYINSFIESDYDSGETSISIYPVSLIDSLTGLTNYSRTGQDNPSGRRVRHYPELLSSISQKLMEIKKPDLLIINIETSKFNSEEDKILTRHGYDILDDIIGKLALDIFSYYKNFVLIAANIDNSTEEKGFMLIKGPSIQDSQKLITVNPSGLNSNLTYLLGLPLLKEHAVPVDSVIFRKNFMAYRPPEYVKVYPPLLKPRKSRW